MNSTKRILVISEAHMIPSFLKTTILKLKKETDLVFDCFSVTPIDEKTRIEFCEIFENVYANEYPKGFLKKIPKIRAFQAFYGLRKLAHRLPMYDIAHIFFHHHYYYLFTPIIREKTKKFFLTFFGSDFNQIENFKHRNNQKTVNLLDGVFATNEVLLERIVKKYDFSGNEKESGITFPFMDILASFEKFVLNNTHESARRAWGINTRMIVCGYNAAPITRHELIIESLEKIENKLHEFKVVFPMTYGNRGAKTRTVVKEKLKYSSLDSQVLEEFLTVEKLLNLRMAADIFVHIQTRDQMCAAMLEHLAAGSVVITGNWLPYDGLIEKGIFMIRINTPQDLPDALIDVINNLEEYKSKSLVNRAIVFQMFRWETIKINWYKYYNLEAKV